MIFTDHLRPPAPGAPRAAAYKDWLHVNLFHPPTAAAMILNASVSGPEGDPASVAGATVVWHAAGRWSADARVIDRARAVVGRESLAVGDLEIALDPVGGGLAVRYGRAGSPTRVAISAAPLTEAIGPAGPVPFGSGWIDWRAVPLMRAAGEVRLGGTALDAGSLLAYHDHNWGRWRWGDDLGWEWGVLPAGDACLVMSRATDREHRRGAPHVTVALPAGAGWLSRSYGGRSVRVECGRWASAALPRVPGAMAVLNAARARPRLPGAISIVADDGFDRIDARVDVLERIQVITADPFVCGYSFIHELLCAFSLRGRCGGRRVASEGRGVVEYVD